MICNFKILLATTVLAVTSMNAFAEIEKRTFCDTQKDVVYRNFDWSVYQSMMRENKITLVNEGTTTRQLDEFFFEYNKFPIELRTEMIRNFATIHLIQGQSVMDDPSWDSGGYTFDNRSRTTTMGAGGMPYANLGPLEHYYEMARYCNQYKNCPAPPQRPPIIKPAFIVVNRMYNEIDVETTNRIHNGQTYYKATSGSVSLLLHEHAHTLDNLYAYKGISSSSEWIALARSADSREYMKVVCKDKNYCLDNDNEAFAELFAYYHACSGSHEHMIRNAPELANFFEGLKEVKNRFNPGVQLPRP